MTMLNVSPDFCLAGLKKPSFSHHAYQNASVYLELYVCGRGHLVSVTKVIGIYFEMRCLVNVSV